MVPTGVTVPVSEPDNASAANEAKNYVDGSLKPAWAEVMTAFGPAVSTATGDQRRNIQVNMLDLADRFGDLEGKIVLRSQGVGMSLDRERSLIDQMLRTLSATHVPEQVAASIALRKLKNTLDQA